MQISSMVAVPTRLCSEGIWGVWLRISVREKTLVPYDVCMLSLMMDIYNNHQEGVGYE